jgi:hypothetical protein
MAAKTVTADPQFSSSPDIHGVDTVSIHLLGFLVLWENAEYYAVSTVVALRCRATRSHLQLVPDVSKGETMSQENWDLVMYSEFTVWIIFFIAVAVIGGIEFAKYLRRSRRRATPPGSQR